MINVSSHEGTTLENTQSWERERGKERKNREGGIGRVRN
jgi:hypothetical protein